MFGSAGDTRPELQASELRPVDAHSCPVVNYSGRRLLVLHTGKLTLNKEIGDVWSPEGRTLSRVTIEMGRITNNSC